MALFTIYEVLIAHEWQKKFGEDQDGSKYTFASLEGAQEFIKEQVDKGTANLEDKVLWYSITGLEGIPCDASNPSGQIYYGMIYHTFQDFQK